MLPSWLTLIEPEVVDAKKLTEAAWPRRMSVSTPAPPPIGMRVAPSLRMRVSSYDPPMMSVTPEWVPFNVADPATVTSPFAMIVIVSGVVSAERSSVRKPWTGASDLPAA